MESFRPAPFRLCSGFLIPPWFTFPQAPLSSRTVGFPESGWQPSLVPAGPSHTSRGLNARSYTPLEGVVIPVARRPVRLPPGGLALCPDGVSAVAPATYREPLCPRWALPTAGWFPHHLRGHYPSFLAPTGSCAPPTSSRGFRFPYTARPCRLRRAPAGRWWFPTLSLRVCPSMLSGRSAARATVGREFPSCTLSVVQRVPSSTIVHVSASPPLIPDGRLSRVRLAAKPLPGGPSQTSRGLNARSYTPLG